MADRRFALTKIDAGDYLLPDNDETHLWRVVRYEDGSHYGLDVPYASRTFWRVLRCRRTVLELAMTHHLGEIVEEWFEWEECDQWLPSRAAALAAIEARMAPHPSQESS